MPHQRGNSMSLDQGWKQICPAGLIVHSHASTVIAIGMIWPDDG